VIRTLINGEEREKKKKIQTKNKASKKKIEKKRCGF